jgi:hypothetical protein
MISNKAVSTKMTVANSLFARADGEPLRPSKLQGFGQYSRFPEDGLPTFPQLLKIG